MDFNKLSMQEKVGQKFMIGVNSHNIDVVIDLIKKYHIGGVILYKKNYSNYDEMLSVIKMLKEANKENKIPLFISIDQEGGRVNRMPSEFKNIKNIYDMSKRDIKLVSENGNITGKMLSQTGINMNFAPVVDIYEEGGSKLLYNRCFFGDVDNICNNCREYVEGLNKNKVISVIKHFPGHGASKMDSHFITPYVYDYKIVLDKHIKPFEYMIDKNVDAIMIGHIIIRKLTNGLPASISSKFITDYLRNKYNYKGLIITDEINMLSHNIFYKFSCMKKALLSGSDIILMKIKDSSVVNIDKYVKLIKSNKVYEEIIDNSVKRILEIKDKYNINDNISYKGCNIEEINERIDKLNKMCSNN